MNKSDYKILFKKLTVIYNDFEIEYNEWLDAPNLKVKNKKYKRIIKNINDGIKWIERYPECIEFITSAKSNMFSKSIALEELKIPGVFNTDVEEILFHLEEKLKQNEE